MHRSRDGCSFFNGHPIPRGEVIQNVRGTKRRFGMLHFSVRTLLVLTLLVSIGLVVFLRVTAKQAYTGLSRDIGDGYESNSFVEKADGDIIGSIGIAISDSMTAKQPRWHPSSPNPPISARSALAIADGFRKHRFRDHRVYDWSLDSVCLTPLNLKENKWCWIIRFEASPKPGYGGSGIWPEFPVYVMMDGSVIEPDDPDGYLKVPEDR